MNNPSSPPVKFTRIECVKEAWELIKMSIGYVGGVDRRALIGAVSMYVLIGAMVCGIFRCYLKKIDGGPVKFDELFEGFKYFGPACL